MASSSPSTDIFRAHAAILKVSADDAVFRCRRHIVNADSRRQLTELTRVPHRHQGQLYGYYAVGILGTRKHGELGAQPLEGEVRMFFFALFLRPSGWVVRAQLEEVRGVLFAETVEKFVASHPEIIDVYERERFWLFPAVLPAVAT